MPISGDSGIDPKQLDKFYASKKDFDVLALQFEGMGSVVQRCKGQVDSHE